MTTASPMSRHVCNMYVTEQRTARSAQCLRVTGQLLQAGADPWARNAAGQTALHSAAAAGEVDIVKALLGALLGSAEPDQASQLRTGPAPSHLRLSAPDLERLVDDAGRTPLHEAAALPHGVQPCEAAPIS